MVSGLLINDENVSIRSMIILCSIFSICIVMAKVIAPLFYIVAVLFSIFCLLFKSKEIGIYFSIFLIPNITIFDDLDITFTVNLLLAISFIRIFFIKNIRINETLLLGWLALTIWELFHILVLGNVEDIFSEISTFLGLFTVMIVSTNSLYKLDKAMVAYSLAFGVIASAFINFIIDPYYLLNLISDISNSKRFMGFASDPNYFALYICLALALIVSFEKFDIKEYFLLICLVFIALLTRSKMCYFLLALISLSFLAENIKGLNSRNGIRIIGLLSCVIGVVIFFRDAILVLIDNVIARAGLGDASGVSLEQLTTGRSIIVFNYFNILSDNLFALFFGAGLKYHFFLGEEAGYVAHNTWLDILLSWGIIGTFIFGVFMFSWIKFYIQNNSIEYKKKNFISVVVLCIGFFSLSCLSSTMFSWVIMATMYSFQARLKSGEVSNICD